MSDEPGPSRATRVLANACVGVATVFLFVAALAGLAFAPRASAGGGTVDLAAAGGTGWIPDVPVAADLTAWEANPALTTASNGNLYMAFQSNAAGNYDIFFTESSDGGLTWSPPVPVVNTGTNEVEPSIAEDPATGRVFVAYRAGTSGATPIRAAYSDDRVTWTDRTVLPCGVSCERPRIVSEYWNGASNVQYVALAGPLGANDWNVAVARSLDDGNTWSWYESGLSASDVRYQPDIAVQRGWDGVGRVFLFYRGGSTFPGSTGYVEWSSNQGASWSARATWYSNVFSPPAVAASHDGRSLLLAYGNNAGQVVWAQAPYPTALASFNGTWDFLPWPGSLPAVSVDGTGTTGTTLGGFYHLSARDASGGMLYTTAPVTLASNADWSPAVTVTDVGAIPSGTYPQIAVATQDRAGTWYPSVAWTDERDGTPDVYYTTPGGSGGGIDVTLDTVPSGLRVTLDGLTRTAPATFWVTAGQHAIAVSSPQPGAPGWRYAFSGWSDGGAISHVIDVTGSASYTATFSAQVLLTVDSPYGSPTGAGWYPQGATATVSVTSPEAGPIGWQYRFTSWSGDISASTASATVLMDAPKFVTANWQAQVFLTIVSPNGGVTGSGWYDRWTDATLSAEPYVDGAPGTRYAFAGWTGDVFSSQRVYTLLMDEPKSVNAVWQTEYLLTVTSGHGNVTGGGWYLANEEVTVTLGAAEVTEGGRVWEFTGWSGDASGTGSVVTVQMTEPKNVTANWREKPNLINTGMWIPILLIAVLAILLLAIFLSRRRKKPGPAFPQMQPLQPIAPAPHEATPAQPPQAPPQPPGPGQPPNP